jgi:hypothetical protein
MSRWGWEAGTSAGAFISFYMFSFIYFIFHFILYDVVICFHFYSIYLFHLFISFIYFIYLFHFDRVWEMLRWGWEAGTSAGAFISFYIYAVIYFIFHLSSLISFYFILYVAIICFHFYSIYLFHLFISFFL